MQLGARGRGTPASRTWVPASRSGRGEVELCFAHPLGSTEVAHGRLDGTTLEVSTANGGSVGRTRSGSDVTLLTRRYVAEADVLSYELDMGTERTPSVLHTTSRLRRDG